ncbi:WecB/TagA/CpsF family glycosyltransferase [Listeria fleischmannii]|jgi:N-acetylglucosaminyldiphosphoundecaprenol N-acetyl-beta-D-mannosaminyltransferase|nr:WecB/TagA/CpsF family glycosyltransferase [Listeria fleischmannii]MBC1417885.1 WecB/TagA/CpsF family glycosyltransferase [Listeria fleischmannii]
MLGSYLDCLTMDETVSEVKKIIVARKPTQHVVINAGKINLMKKNEALRNIVNSCPLINADGSSIVLAGKFLGHPVPERVTGIDLMERLLKEASEENYSLFLLGATEEVVQEVKRIIKLRYPAANIVGCQNGYFDRHDSKMIAEEIRESQADILFVAFSSPEKEFWINQYLDIMNVPFVMGVGGSFDVLAGKTTRAPKLFQKMGCEWLWRFLQEPRRMFKRYFIGNFEFLKHVLKEKGGVR